MVQITSRWQNQLNNSITHCLSQLRATALFYNARYNRNTSVQCRCIDLYQLALFNWPNCSPASVTCDRKQDKLCISRFDPSSVHAPSTAAHNMQCYLLCMALHAAKGLLLANLSMPRHAVMMQFIATSRSGLPYSSRLYLTLQTDFFLPLVPSPA